MPVLLFEFCSKCDFGIVCIAHRSWLNPLSVSVAVLLTIYMLLCSAMLLSVMRFDPSSRCDLSIVCHHQRATASIPHHIILHHTTPQRHIREPRHTIPESHIIPYIPHYQRSTASSPRAARAHKTMSVIRSCTLQMPLLLKHDQKHKIQDTNTRHKH